MAPHHGKSHVASRRGAVLLLALVLLPRHTALAAAGIAGSGPGAMVAMLEQVQPPAWVLHQGTRTPAKPALGLYAGDRILTGDQGHVVVVLGQYGRLSLGSQGQLELQNDGIQAGGRLPLALALHGGLASYAAPGPTALIRAPVLQIGRQLRVQEVTGRIWMQADQQGVARLGLLTGAVQLQAGDRPSIVLERPGQELTVDAAAGQPLIRVRSEAERAVWLQSTSIQAGRPVLVAGGAWAVATPLLRLSGEAELTACRFQGRGYPVELRVLPGHAGTRYRLELSGLPSPRDAARLRDQLRAAGLRDAQVATARQDGHLQHCPQAYLPQPAPPVPARRDETLSLRASAARRGQLLRPEWQSAFLAAGLLSRDAGG